MGYYTHKDKVSGDGLALTEWNTLSTAVAGNSGLTLALTPGDKVGIGTASPTAKLTVAGDVNIGGNGNGRLKVRHVDGKLHTSDTFEHLYLNWDTGKDVFVGGGADANLKVFGKIYAKGNVGIGTESPTAKLQVSGSVMIEGSNTLEFGGNVAGKEVNAGKIGYGTFTSGALDIVGAGPTWPTRRVKIFAEGGLTVAGNVGIGMETAVEKLEVAGKVKATHFVGDGSGLTNLTLNGVSTAIHAGNSDLYFTKTDHQHTGFGNTQGYAAIENATNFDCLMILGRQTPTGRKIGLWDHVTVNGTLTATRYLGINLAWGAVQQTDWINNWDAVMNYRVPEGCVMVGLYSEHNNDREDRRFIIFYRTLGLSGI